MNPKKGLLFLWLILLYQTSFGQTFSSSDLPVLIINTGGKAIPNEPKIVASLTVIDNGTGQRNSLTDKATLVSTIGIEQRGSTSRELFPKKPYGIELREADGVTSVNASLLGMPAESDWVLNATYNDKTLIREALTYDLNRQMSRYYTPRFRYCELMLNGQYEGVYILFEKIKRDKNRVDMANLKKTDLTGDALTGGYLLKVDKTEGSPSRSWTSSQPNINGRTFPIQIDRPKPEDLAEEQFQYIKQYVTAFEKALAGNDFRDPATGYARYLDDNSAVDYLLLTEISRNVDGYRLSTFLYKDRDSKNGKLTMGPIWDYNLTYGNANYCQGSQAEGWAYNFNRVCPGDYYTQPFWWERLLQDPAFTTKVRQRYQTLRQGVLTTSRVHAYIDSVAASIKEARTRNFIRWPVLGQYVWPNSYVGRTYDDEINFLKDWVQKRLNWLDGAMPLLDNALLAVDPIIPADLLSLQVGPVPMAETVTIRFRLSAPADVQLLLTDQNGRSAFEIKLPAQSVGEHEQIIANHQLPHLPGVYVLSLLADGQLRASRKVLKH